MRRNNRISAAGVVWTQRERRRANPLGALLSGLWAVASALPLRLVLMIGALGFVVISQGVPHLRYEYEYRGARTNITSCRYIGLRSFEAYGGANCPLIRFVPLSELRRER